MKLPYLSKAHIAERAGLLLAGYARRRGAAADPPIPVEDLIERDLGLQLAFVDFEALCGLSDVLGAVYVPQRRVCIDEGLLAGGAEGRFCFTCAREAGHWVLHRGLIPGGATRTAAILCRTGSARAPIEWQADDFAACLLMPEAPMRRAFAEAFGVKTLDIVKVDSAYAGPACFDPCADNWTRIADRMRQVGGGSNVSKQAMIIRLQDLGLVVNATPVALGWVRRRSG